MPNAAFLNADKKKNWLVQSQRQPIRGLTADEMAARRARGLGSVPPPATSRSYLQILQENVFTTVNSILFSVGFALVLVGQYLDALVSVGVISFNMVISLIQEIRRWMRGKSL